MTVQRWVRPDRVTLLSGVRDIVQYNPERHNQEDWLSNKFSDSDDSTVFGVEEIRSYIGAELPDSPADPDRPVCGTKACVAGWIAIMAAPPGTRITRDGDVILTDGRRVGVMTYASEATQLGFRQAWWLFDAARGRDEIIDALGTLIDNPDAELR